MKNLKNLGYKFQKIWGNSLIKHAHKPFFDKVWLNSGVDSISQLKHEKEPRLLGYIEFCEKYGKLLPQMAYNSLISAIPPAWRSVIKYKQGVVDVNYKNKYEKIESRKLVSKDFYWQMVNRQKKDETLIMYWEKE